ncbi:unnamed protein product [Caenorhabditis bovis]|uniref:Poly [ADP-ribose] polymerase n=1 Tax=Caenorhabditis bovis TaxID=2654633 RepID=A0A8S1F6T9_9PELO|nr:unnamed protein product [Caenorhabditis bovis]
MEGSPVDGEELRKIKNCFLLCGRTHSFSPAIHKVTKYNHTKRKDVVPKNKKLLLWHGTKNENVDSILKNGFKIRNNNGLMYGNAIYLANIPSKAVRYCSTGYYGDRTTSKMLLCEVDVSELVEVTRADHGAHEKYKKVVKGVGMFSPTQTEIIDNVHCFCGNIEARPRFDLDYDEYAVYDPDLITVKYVVEFYRQ